MQHGNSKYSEDKKILLLLLLFIYFSLALQIVHKIINYND